MSTLNIFQDWQAGKGNPKSQLVMLHFRIAHLLRQSPVTFVLFIWYFIAYRVIVEWVLCIELPWKTRIGPGFRIEHGQALVVNDGTVFGANCIVRNSCTIGNCQLKDGNYSRAPRFGNGIVIGANAVIIGDITIGDNALIGAGAVVLMNVPADHTAIGNPARIIPRV